MINSGKVRSIRRMRLGVGRLVCGLCAGSLLSLQFSIGLELKGHFRRMPLAQTALEMSRVVASFKAQRCCRTCSRSNFILPFRMHPEIQLKSPYDCVIELGWSPSLLVPAEIDL